jgi:hypothetical protein
MPRAALDDEWELTAYTGRQAVINWDVRKLLALFVEISNPCAVQKWC